MKSLCLDSLSDSAMQGWQSGQSLEPASPQYDKREEINKSNSYHGELHVPTELFKLQNEVSSLLEFKNAFLKTFPHLHQMKNGVPNQPQRPEDVRRQLGMSKAHSSHDLSDEIHSSWKGSMPRHRKLRKSPEGSSTDNGITVADSGFSTSGTSTLLSHPPGNKGQLAYPPEVRWDTWTGAAASLPSPTPKEDELMFLLDVIHWKTAKMRSEGEEQERSQLGREESRKLSDRSRVGITLGAISENEGTSSDNEIKASDVSGDSPKQRRKASGVNIAINDRELLLDRISELELESMQSQTEVSKLKTEISRISRRNELLENQLRTTVLHNSEFDTKIHDMHSEYVKSNVGRGKDVGSSGIIHSINMLTGGAQKEPSFYRSENNYSKTNEFRKMMSQSESNLRRVGAGVPDRAGGTVNIEIRRPDVGGLSRNVGVGRGGLSRMSEVPISHSVSVVNLKGSSENLHTGRSFSDINALSRHRTNSLSASTGTIHKHSSRPSVLYSDPTKFFQNKVSVPPNKKVPPQLNRVLSNENFSLKSRSVENLHEQQKLHLKPATSEMSLPQRTSMTSSRGYLPSPQEFRLKAAQSEQVLTQLGAKKRPEPANPIVSMPAELTKGPRVKPNREKIRQILSTTSVIELQRQLLTTVMENEVYKSQISRVTKGWNSKMADFEEENSGLQATNSQLREENDRLRFQVEEKSIELEGTRARLRQLEKDQPTGREIRPSVVSNKQVQTDKILQDHRQGFKEGLDNYVKFGPPDQIKEEPSVTFDLGLKKAKILEVPSAKKAVTIENFQRRPSQLPNDAKQRLQEMAGTRKVSSSSDDIRKNISELLAPGKSSSKSSTLPLPPTTPPSSLTKTQAPAIPTQDTPAENKTKKRRISLSRKDSRGSESSAKNSILNLQNNNVNKGARETLPKSVLYQLFGTNWKSWTTNS